MERMASWKHPISKMDDIGKPGKMWVYMEKVIHKLVVLMGKSTINDYKWRFQAGKIFQTTVNQNVLG